MDEANFSFVIVDANNLKFENFKAFWSAGQVMGSHEPSHMPTAVWQCLGTEILRSMHCSTVTCLAAL